jgi:hypothetical protein
VTTESHCPQNVTARLSIVAEGISASVTGAATTAAAKKAGMRKVPNCMVVEGDISDLRIFREERKGDSSREPGHLIQKHRTISKT